MQPLQIVNRNRVAVEVTDADDYEHF